MYEALSGLPLAQIVILCFLIFFFLEGKTRFNNNSQNILILGYLFWFYITYLFSFKPDLAWVALVDFTKWVVIYFLLINTVNDRKRLYIFVVVFLLLNFKYTQFAVRIWVSDGFYSDPRGLNAGGGAGTGFFKNPNDFAIAINSVFGISYYMIQFDLEKFKGWVKMRWFHIACSISMVLAILASSSRGGALGLGMISLAIWYKSKRKALGAGALIVVMMIFIALIPEDNWERFRSMGSEEDGSSQSRMELWRAGMRMASEYPITGVGPNNFIYVNTELYSSEYKEVQHNVFVQAVSELGYPGLFLFLTMVVCCFRNHKKTREILRERGINDLFLKGLSHGLDICLVGFLTNGFFITVLYYPFFWMLFILSAALLDAAKYIDHLDEKVLKAENMLTTTKFA